MVMTVETLTSITAAGTADGNGGQRRQMATAMATKTGSGVAAAATVAMAVADNNRYCGGREQSTICGSSSGRDSGRGSKDLGSMAATAGRGGGAVEVTAMRAVATATTVMLNVYPFFALAMAR